MGEIHPAVRYPTWVLQWLFLSAVALVFGAILLLAGLHGLPNSPVLAVHCLVNAFVLLTVWNGRRAEDEGWWPLQMAANLAAIGLGLVDLVLAGHAATHLQPNNAVLLALALPGVAGVITYYLDHFRRKTTEETAAEDDAVLAREDGDEETDEGGPLTAGEKFRAYASVVLFLTAYYALFFGGMWLCFIWYGIVWRAVNDGVVLGTWDVLMQAWHAIQSHWSTIVRTVLVIAGMMTVSLIWTMLDDWFKRFRNRRKKPNSGLNTRVDAAVRAVWDYANRPGRRANVVPVYVLPILLFLAWAATMIAFGAAERQLALRLFEARRGIIDGWYYFYGTSDGFVFVMIGAGVLFAALWYWIVGVWPGAAEAAVTVRYRRNAGNASQSVEKLRGCLTRLFKKGGGELFDAREYLLGRRRRFVRWVFAVAAVVVPLALAGVWAALNSYTLFTSGGLVRQSPFASAAFLPWHEVRSVEIGCTLDSHSRAEVSWLVRAADGRSADLVGADAVERRLPGLLKVDAILRGQSTQFNTRVPATGESRASDACLEKAGTDLRDFRGFLHVMHQD